MGKGGVGSQQDRNSIGNIPGQSVISGTLTVF
jgi:hypothetical protein